MARSRNIKPGFFTNDVLGELPALTRLLFAGLWIIADREGRIEDRPKKIRAEILPYDQCDADEMLQDLENNGFILRYTSGAFKVIQVLAWDKHQNPHVKEAPSTLPAYVEHQTSTVQEQCSTQPLPERAGLIPDSLLLIPDSLISDSLETRNSTPPAATPSKAGAACVVIKSEGISPVNPSHPELIALIEAGADIGHFSQAAKMASEKKKGFAYVLGIVKSQLAEAQALADSVQAGGGRPGIDKPQPETFKERDDRNARARWEEMTGRTHPDNLPKNAATVIDAQMLELTHD